DRASALAAIDLIVEQGEGTGQTPEVVPDTPDDPDQEYAHYYKFAMIYHGRRLVRNPDPAAADRYSYSGSPVPFDPEGVFPVPTNPKAEDFAAFPEAKAKIDAFNREYTDMLRLLHRAANGEPSVMPQATSQMKFSIAPLAESLVALEVSPGLRAAPTFEYLAPLL
ncbi:hypothetical protein EON79_18040, partial [bacterium]